VRPFSQRHGHLPASDSLQLQGMDDDLRVGIWNAIHSTYFAGGSSEALVEFTPFSDASLSLWVVFFKLPVDQMPSHGYQYGDMLKRFVMDDKSTPWFRVYDLVEFLHDRSREAVQRQLTEVVNIFLSNERSGYRLVGGQITPLTSQEELAAVDDAIEAAPAPVRRHLEKALSLFADREAPDYANSVKESISAVEAACQQVLGAKVTAGDGLKRLRERLDLHPALAEGFSKLYGFTSAAGSIRHANHGDSTVVSEEEARYFMVTCSAFVNYLIARSIKIDEQPA
jgi:hypothetical protein